MEMLALIAGGTGRTSRATLPGGLGSGTDLGGNCQMGNTRRSTGTGRTFHLKFLPPLFYISRFLKQWMMVWNGYDGRIYISSSQILADQAFAPARVLVEKNTDQEKNW